MSVTATDPEELAAALSVPTRLVVAPTNLAAAYPYGGTSIGLVRDVVLEVQSADLEVTAEEFGQEVVDVVDGGESWKIRAAVRGWSRAAHDALFLEASTSSTTGKPLAVAPATNRRAGRLRSSDAVVLLAVPHDPTRHPAILFRSAIPRRAAPLLVEFGLSTELLWGVSWTAIRDAAGAAAQIGLLEDLSLAP